MISAPLERESTHAVWYEECPRVGLKITIQVLPEGRINAMTEGRLWIINLAEVRMVHVCVPTGYLVTGPAGGIEGVTIKYSTLLHGAYAIS